jgi:hypothetical protein
MTHINGLSKIYTNADTKNSGHQVIRTSSPPHTPPLHPYAQVMFPYRTIRIWAITDNIKQIIRGTVRNPRVLLVAIYYCTKRNTVLYLPGISSLLLVAQLFVVGT